MTMNVSFKGNYMRLPFAGAILIILHLLLLSLAQAQPVTKEFRMVCNHTRIEIIKVEDRKDHDLYFGESRGLASFQTGEVAEVDLKWCIDLIKGTGRIVILCIRLRFEDGSTIDFAAKPNMRPIPPAKGVLYKMGPLWTYQGGGRYAGISGKLIMTGRSLESIEVEVPFYLDCVMSYGLSFKY